MRGAALTSVDALSFRMSVPWAGEKLRSVLGSHNYLYLKNNSNFWLRTLPSQPCGIMQDK